MMHELARALRIAFLDFRVTNEEDMRLIEKPDEANRFS